MIIGGLEKLTLIDYPGKLAAIVFTKGCNFRCGFCHNPSLVLPDTRDAGKTPCSFSDNQGQPLIQEDDLFYFLEKRKGKLDGVVITGGEPTLHYDLLDFIKKIKDLGFLVKLDTNGTNPQMLQKILDHNLIDYIAMDLKSDESGYARTVGVSVDFDKILESVKIIVLSGLPHEFRTTIVPGFHDEKIIANMAQIIKGADKWFLQDFKSDTNLVDSSLENKQAMSDEQMDKLVEIGRNVVKQTCARR